MTSAPAHHRALEKMYLGAPINAQIFKPLLANFCHHGYPFPMSTMNISLPVSLKSFVDEQVTQRGYGTSSEYVRTLIRKDQDRAHLRSLLLGGAASAPAGPADAAFFDRLREGVRQSDKR